MLEWETAATTERRLGAGLADFVASMWQSSAFAAAVCVLVAVVKPAAMGAASPVLAIWLLSPLIAWWMSQKQPVAEAILTEPEQRELRRIARRTWHFFETFVGDVDNWLPPDNFQEDPEGRIAHRTSPTNMGLLLLASLSAHDFGYIGVRNLLRRLTRSFDTFDRIEKQWGHFLNWYNTRTLEPLPPAYVSTVDSGNMLGCLVTLGQGLRELLNAPIIGNANAAGLRDTLGVVADALRQRKPPTDAEGAQSYKALESDLKEFDAVFEAISHDLDLIGWYDLLGQLDRRGVGLVGRVRSLLRKENEGPEKLESWARLFLSQVQEFRAELDALAPWLSPLSDLVESSWSDPADSSTFHRVRQTLAGVKELKGLAEIDRSEPLLKDLDGLETKSGRIGELIRAVVAGVRQSSAAGLVEEAKALIVRAEILGAGMDFQPLYKPDRHLFAIGCNLVQGRLDNACYDLVASEAALTSFLTIARGEAPRRHWFQLGRPYTRAAGRIGLISWGGTMFEYLMPRLMMKSLEGTLVSEACATAVARQIEYGKAAGVPWGISESSFGKRNVEGDYDYQAFGVPGLGLKRGARARPGDCPLCDGAGHDDPASRRSREFPQARRRGRAWKLRLL